MPTTTPSPLDTLEEAFDALTSGPQPLALDGTAVGGNLPARPVPLDELRELLLDRSVPYAARDAAIGELLRRAKSEPAWIVGLAGVLLPGLRRIAGRVAREFPGDTADVDAEILAGFVEAVRGVEACGPRLAARLLAVPWNRAKVARRAEMACAGRKVPAQSSAAPVRPWGHPDLVLDRAVAAGAVTHEEAEIIGATRLGGAGLAEVAAEHGVSYGTLRRRRYRAECRLVRWLSNGSSPVPKRSRPGIRSCGSGSGRHRQAAGRCALAHDTEEVRAPRPGRRPEHRPAHPSTETERSRH